MLRLVVIFLLCSCCAMAQDKVFFSNGNKRNGKLMAITPTNVLFKTSDTTGIETFHKKDILLVETLEGKRYLFSHPDTAAFVPPSNKETNRFRSNSIGIQPFNLFTGRATFVYERFLANRHISIAVPLILTFDPTAVFASSVADTTFGYNNRAKGPGFISGLDINIFPNNDESGMFYFGPRFRYGRNVFIFNIQAMTFQTQFGIRLGDPSQAVVQYFSAGFGFVRFIETPGSGSGLDRRRSYMWFSVNYRIAISW